MILTHLHSEYTKNMEVNIATALFLNVITIIIIFLTETLLRIGLWYTDKEIQYVCYWYRNCDNNENIFPRMIIEAQFICILMGYSKIAQEKDNTNVLKYGTKCC